MKYINADKIQEVIDWYEHKEIVSDTDLQCAFIDIMNLPSADVVEVKHGEWLDKGSLSCRCSNCGCKSSKESKFCPDCGADMRERKETDE